MLHRVTRAIYRRDMRRWFGNPTGYVFLALFVFVAAARLFWAESFFQNNLANLDALNEWFPFLLVFLIAAVAMSVWAGERGLGTDELLFTLPARDHHIVLGKFLAAAGIYTIALAFTFPLPLMLAFLGNPDWGLILSNYLAYWLLGTALISASMVGSQLSDNLTVAFIFGSILGAAIALAETVLGGLVGLFSTALATWMQTYGPIGQFQELARGVISISSIVLFLGITAAFLYLNLVLLGRRMWRPRREHAAHFAVRFACLLVMVSAGTALGSNMGGSGDLTQEQVHSLSEETRQLLADIPPDRSVYVQAFVSPVVPTEYVRARRTLLDLLRQYDAMGGDRVRVRVVETERHTDEAREAQEIFDIQPQSITTERDGQVMRGSIYMGVAFTSGIEEVVIPFLDKGLPVEYELTRSIRVVSSAERRKVGILTTDLNLFGGFDFQNMSQTPEWEIVRELKLQYDVERVDAGSDYPEDLDVLIAAMASSLPQDQMDRLAEYIEAGNTALIIDDPFPASAQNTVPADPKGGARNPFQSQGQPPPEPKGDFMGFLRRQNIEWVSGGFGPAIIWDLYNPRPQFAELWPPEWVFVGAHSAPNAINPDQRVTSGLQELVMMFCGACEPGARSDVTFIPLLKSTKDSGRLPLDTVFRKDPFFGMRQYSGNLIARRVDGSQKSLACRVTGKATAEAEKAFDVIFVSDLDMFSSQFFALRREGIEDLNFDNVTFLLNCVDELAGDTSFVELRKRRPQHRTLSLIEAKTAEFNQKWLEEKQRAEEKAESRLAEARARLDEAIVKIEEDSSLDDRSKSIQIESKRDVEQRRLEVQEALIEDEKNKALDLAEQRKTQDVKRIRNFYKVGCVALAPLPAIFFGIFSLLRRSRREVDTSRNRAQGGA